MIGIYFICYLCFPFLVLFQIKNITGKSEFLGKYDTDVIKGIATCLIILAHLIIPMKENLHGIGFALNIYAYTGGIGVLLFFFVSGYGIYKGYGQSKLTDNYWIKRLLNVYLPCVLIQLFFCCLKMTQEEYFDIKNFLKSVFLGAWFIDVIMIQYLIFYIAKKTAKNNTNLLVSSSFLLSVLIACVFWYKGFNPRWYNGLLLFPTGMLIAHKEKNLLTLIQRRWVWDLIVSGILFIILGGIFAYGKNVYKGVDICKFMAGVCLCLFVCILNVHIQLCSNVMLYIGRRSLFFYLIHSNVLNICENVETNYIKIFYIVILSTFILVEIFYRIYQLFRAKKSIT